MTDSSKTARLAGRASTGTGMTHLSIALGVQAARRGHRVAFATAHDWVQRLGGANRRGELDKNSPGSDGHRC